MKRIKYISRFATPMTARDIERIAAQSAANNKKAGVTGLLMATGGVFFQVIEGPDEAVSELYSRILRDPRHQDVLTLRVEEGDLRRLFPNWEMKKVDLDSATDLRLEPMKAVIQAVMRQGEIISLLTSTLERAVWQEFTITPAKSPTAAPSVAATAAAPAARPKAPHKSAARNPRPAGAKRSKR
jgi:hypothetical protein